MSKSAVERALRVFLRYWSVTFAVVGSLFVLAPNGTVRVINAVGSALGDFPPAPESNLRFWLSLGFSYMVLVTVLAWMASSDLYGRRVLVLILAIGKAASSLSCLVFYWTVQPCFIYLLNFLVDGSIVLMMIPVYRLIGQLPHWDERPAAASGPCPRDRAVMRAILTRLYPRTARVPFGADDVDLDEQLWRYAEQRGPVMAAATRALMKFFDFAPILFAFRLARFTSLSDQDALRFLEDCAGSRLYPRRMALFNVKFLADMHFYADPRVREALGYVEPPLPAQTGPLDKVGSVWAWRAKSNPRPAGGAR